MDDQRLTDRSAPRRDKTPVMLIIVCAPSLLLNALAIGVAPRPRRLRESLSGGDTAALTLTAELRKDILAAIAKAPNPKADLGRVQDARKAVVIAATAKPFDRTTTEAAMTALRGEVTTLMAHCQQVVLDELSSSPAP